MFDLVGASVKPLMLNYKILEIGYELYLKAPQTSHPVINLRDLSYKTGKSLLECRNAIIEANKLGRFPDCALEA
jgi:hypothetical protein